MKHERACLVSVNLEDEECMWTFFEGQDAIERAWGLRVTIERDWPGCEWIVVGNEAAKEQWRNLIEESVDTLNQEKKGN